MMLPKRLKTEYLEEDEDEDEDEDPKPIGASCWGVGMPESWCCRGRRNRSVLLREAGAAEGWAKVLLLLLLLWLVVAEEEEEEEEES